MKQAACLIALFCLFGEYGSAKASDVISLAFPLKCEIGINCFVQNYVDHGLPGAPRDFRCAARTYAGHSGTDIRISKRAIAGSSAEILAAAPGKVIATRDGVEEVSIREVGKSSIAGKECGNGVVIQHDEGWQTQYCHMAKGSMAVGKADQVRAGTVLGRVGLSGETEFFHLHFVVRHKSDVVDPFAYQAAPNSCNGGRSLWGGHASTLLQYRDTELIDVGFSDLAPSMDAVENGNLVAPTRKSSAIVAFARAIGLQAGDEQVLILRGPPDRALIAQYRDPGLAANKAQYLVVAGKQRGQESWPSGRFEARYALLRQGKEILVRTFTLNID